VPWSNGAAAGVACVARGDSRFYITGTNFDLNNIFFTSKCNLLRQIMGIAMGSPLRPALAILNCAYHEHLFHKFLESNHRAIAPDFFSVRYMDDLYRLSWFLTVILKMLIATSTLTDPALRFIQFSMIFFISATSDSPQSAYFTNKKTTRS
jgi:hypothetical protein